MNREIYLDHAATSFPKPPEVMRAIASWAEKLGASAGRGDYPRAVGTGTLIQECREQLARLLGIADSRRVIFTLNCTDALNMALSGLNLRPGDRVVTGSTEHNSVMRPLNALVRDRGLELVKVPADPDGFITPGAVAQALAVPTRLVVLQHSSNVLGAIHDVGAIGVLCRAQGATFLVDAAQTAGNYPLAMEELGIDLLAMPGHKGLQGPQGTGVLAVGPRVELEPLRMGGTGSQSEEEWQPSHYPDRLEAGSHNALGLSGLLAAVEWIERRGVDGIRRHEEKLLHRFLTGLAELERTLPLRVLGPRDAARKSPVVAITSTALRPVDFAARLWDKHRIMVRPGLHCAPGAHYHAGSFPDGAVRFSFGPFTETAHIDRALAAIERILA